MSLRPSDFFAIGAAVSVWASVHMVLRLLCRQMVKIPFGLDDFWAIVAWFFLICLNVSTGYLFLGGHLTYPADAISPNSMDQVLKAWYANHVMFFFIMLCCKLSTIFFYLRLFTTKLFRIASFIVAMLCITAFVGGLTPFAVQCKPTEHVLSPDHPDTCLSLPALFLGINLSNFFTSVFVLVLPIPFVWALNLPVHSRATLSFVFCMGGIACIFSLVRTILQMTWIFNFDTMVGDCSLWTVLEPALTLYAVCLPALRPLIPRSSNMNGMTGDRPGELPPYKPEDHFASKSVPARWSDAKAETWSSDGTVAPAHVAYAECYHPLDAYGRAYNNVRSAFNPGRGGSDARSSTSMASSGASGRSGSLKNNQSSWFDDPNTPPMGIMVRSDVFVEEGYSSRTRQAKK